MNDQAIAEWLEELASAAPAPGGGGAAALETAMAAALVEMVCNLTIGKPAYAEHDAAMAAVLERSTVLRREAVGLAGEDAEAFRAVIAAYRIPKEDGSRQAQIQAALAAAADVPRRTAAAATEILDLIEAIAPIGNVNVISDGAAAASAARGALQTALLNIDANRVAIEDPLLREDLASAAAAIDAQLLRADAIVATIRARMAG
ncbi:MAG TPA: cyclodeaminase/cyclohydrolase family protein [Gaiellaceae bacterium]|nr:cyclodeaminase/cyclohydrolase family protein [Gaiellaceae bacterium]